MQRCFGCMKEFGKEYDVCPYCGYIVGTEPEVKSHLIPGTQLAGRYVLGKAIGHGGFGITYIAWDNKIQKAVAIKEYFPNSFSTRSIGETQVSCYNSKAEGFLKEGIKKMLDEARRISRFAKNENIVDIYDFFEENNTAYIVMEYLEGKDLKKHLEENGGKLAPERAVEIILPVLNALEEMHRDNIIHRDISPDNIFLCDNGKVKLLDFGSARLAVEDSDKSLSVMVKRGYAPKEQYASRSKQGPWTDVYAVCATLYKMITGELPAESTEREDAPLKSFADFGIVGYDELEKVVFKGLEVDIKDRIQTVSELKNGLTESVAKKPETIEETPKKSITPKSKKPKANINIKAIAAVAAAVVLVVAGAFGIKAINAKRESKSFDINSSTANMATKTTKAAETQVQIATASKEVIAKAMKTYEAKLAEFEKINSAYACDINKDGISEIVFCPDVVGEQYMMTYTEKSGLCMVSLSGHSGIIPDVYLSEENRIFLRDDGHNKGSSGYHYAAFYSINDFGFSKTRDVVGDEWEDFDRENDQLFEEMNKKYNKIFEEKLNKEIGTTMFKLYSNVAVYEDVEKYLNKELSINISEKREEYNKKYNEFYNIAESFNSDEVLEFVFGDYDYDGTYEAFAFSGYYSGEETGYSGSVLFINRDGEDHVLQTGAFRTTGEVVGGKYNNYFQISNSFTSVAPVTIWQVIGKTCDTALEIEGLESFSFDLTQSTTYPYFSETLIADASDYDGTVNSISETTGFGHTFKPYFFYETPDGIAEYGGKELPLSELEKAEGYDKVKSIIDEEGYSINNIYFRENGIININLYKKESSDAEYTEYSCSYINLAYVNGRLEMLSDIDGNYFGEGIYLSSKSTGLATFPSQDSIIE